MSQALERVALRISRDVGLSRTRSLRIAKKLNKLAARVQWATPVDGFFEASSAHAPRRKRMSKAKRLKRHP